MGLERRSFFLSENMHRHAYEYFLFMDEQNLSHFKNMWGKIKDFDPFYTRRISLIPLLIARAMPNHASGSAKQRETMRFLKDNFHIWEEKSISTMRDLDSGNLLAIIQGLANLNITPSKKFLDKWSKQLRICLRSTNLDDEFAIKDRSLALLSLGVLQSQNPDIDLHPQYKELRSHIQDEELASDENKKQVHDADLYFTDKTTIKNPNQQNKKIPKTEKSLRELFKKAGFKVYKSKKSPIPLLRQAIDFTVEDSLGRKIHIEVDGPTHFFNPRAKDFRNLKFNLSTRFRSALMTKLAPEAIITRVDFRTLEFILSKSNKDGSISKIQKSFCKAVFAKSIVNGAGCYHVDLGNENLLTDMVKKPAEGFNPEQSLMAKAPRRPSVNDNGELPAHQNRPHSQSPETPVAPVFAAK